MFTFRMIGLIHKPFSLIPLIENGNKNIRSLIPLFAELRGMVVLILKAGRGCAGCIVSSLIPGGAIQNRPRFNN